MRMRLANDSSQELGEEAERNTRCLGKLGKFPRDRKTGLSVADLF
jgi:hypothetical protein